MASQVRMNYHEDCEASINKQVNMELYASYVYMSMSYFFDRDDVALPGMKHFFKEMSDEEREHAEKLMKFQNKRGGRVVLQAINAPAKQEWGNAHDALTTALELERQVNQSLLDIHSTASRTNDPHLTDFLESEFLEEQVSSIKKFGDMITQLKRTGTSGLGEYLFDQNQKS